MFHSTCSPELAALGMLFSWLSGCISFLIFIVALSGGLFPPAGLLRVTSSIMSCILLCRYGQVVLKRILLCV